MTHLHGILSIAAALVILMSVPISAQDQTVDQLNGHDWLSWNEQARYEYALGYTSGVFFSVVALYQMCGGHMSDPDALRAYHMLVSLTKLSVTDVQNRIDRYYRDSGNLQTPLVTVPFIQVPIEGEASYE
jgi:hypothetical protein